MTEKAKPSECLVSAEDYAIYWDGATVIEADPIWNGEDRRSGKKDRRATAHERRWESQRGRRRFAGSHDRRKG